MSIFVLLIRKLCFPILVIDIVQAPIEGLEFSVILFMVTKSLFKVPEHGSHPSRKASSFRLRRRLLMNNEAFSQTKGIPPPGFS